MPRHVDSTIDSAIMNILQKAQTRLGYNELYRELVSKYGRKSIDVFNRHISRLVDAGDIGRRDTGEGRRGRSRTVEYSITSKGAQTLRLQEYSAKLDNGNEQEKEGMQERSRRLQKTFQLLLLFEANKDIGIGEELFVTQDELVEWIRSEYGVYHLQKRISLCNTVIQSR